MIERGCDSCSAACVGSADVEKFYDCLPLLQLCKHLVKLGIPHNLLSTCLSFQMFPKIKLSLLGTDVLVNHRSRGGLTGSRVAGVFGKVVGLDLACACEGSWESLSLDLGFRVISTALWIDDLFSFAPTPENAVGILEIAEEHL